MCFTNLSTFIFFTYLQFKVNLHVSTNFQINNFYIVSGRIVVKKRLPKPLVVSSCSYQLISFFLENIR